MSKDIRTMKGLAPAFFLVAQALACKELHVVVVSGHCMILMLCSDKVKWVILVGNLHKQGES